MCNGPDNILWWLSSERPTCNAGDPGLLSGSGRAPGEENGNPLQYFCLGNPIDRGVWWATVQSTGSQGVRHKEGDTCDWVIVSEVEVCMKSREQRWLHLSCDIGHKNSFQWLIWENCGRGIIWITDGLLSIMIENKLLIIFIILTRETNAHFCSGQLGKRIRFRRKNASFLWNV